MMKKLFELLFVSMLVFTVATPLRGQESTRKPARGARWEGTVVRLSSEQSTLVVRQVGGSIEKTISFDSATTWNSQYQGSDTVEKINASQVKEGDRVICLGLYNEKSEFHATTISKQLSHSPK